MLSDYALANYKGMRRVEEGKFYKQLDRSEERLLRIDEMLFTKKSISSFIHNAESKPKVTCGPVSAQTVGYPVELDNADGEAIPGIHIDTTTETHSERIIREIIVRAEIE